MNFVTCLAQADGSNDGNLVLRDTTSLAARPYSVEVGIIHLDLSLSARMPPLVRSCL